MDKNEESREDFGAEVQKLFKGNTKTKLERKSPQRKKTTKTVKKSIQHNHLSNAKLQRRKENPVQLQEDE